MGAYFITQMEQFKKTMKHNTFQLLKRFRRSHSGATALEFAMIIPVLMYVFMAIIEVALMFFASVNIDGAAIDAARRIRTGQAQGSGDAETDFSTAFCNGLSSAIPCGNVFYDVRTVASFSAVSLTTDTDPVTGDPITYGFAAGGAGDITVVRAMYYWSFNTPLIGQFFESGAGTNKRLLVSTVVFQTEPYE